MTVIKIIEGLLYVLLLPLAWGLLTGGERYLRSALKGKKKLSDPFQPFRDLIGLFRLIPIKEEPACLYCAALNAFFGALAGCVFLVRGNLIAVIILIAIANAAYAAGFWFSARNASEGRTGEDNRRNGERELFRGMVQSLLYSMVIMGCFLVTGFYTGRGSFSADGIWAAETVVGRFFPAVLTSMVVFGLFLRRKSYVDDNAPEIYTGRNLAILELGRWYESAVYFGMLFLLHFSGNLLSGLVGGFVCLLAGLLRILLLPFSGGLRDRMLHMTIGWGLFLLCLLNFALVLGR